MKYHADVIHSITQTSQYHVSVIVSRRRNLVQTDWIILGLEGGKIKKLNIAFILSVEDHLASENYVHKILVFSVKYGSNASGNVGPNNNFPIAFFSQISCWLNKKGQAIKNNKKFDPNKFSIKIFSTRLELATQQLGLPPPTKPSVALTGSSSFEFTGNLPSIEP